MTTLKPFDNLLAIEVPATDKDFYISGLNYLCSYKENGYRDVVENISGTGYWQILGCVTPTEIDFDCESIVECIEVGEYKYGGELHPKDLFLDYETNTYWLENYDDSFRSLLSYNGIEIKEGYKLVILEKQ